MQEIWNGAYMHDIWQTDIRYLMYIFLTHASTFHIPGSLHAMAAPLVRGENRTCGHAHWIMLGGWGNGGNVDGPCMFNARACWHSLSTFLHAGIDHATGSASTLECPYSSLREDCRYLSRLRSHPLRTAKNFTSWKKTKNAMSLRCGNTDFISTTCKEKHTLFLM